jgi:protein TonB
VAVKINTSSGDSFLDQAALEIVRRSAPFGVFTPAMKKKADILDITRTFNFKRDSVTLKAD